MDVSVIIITYNTRLMTNDCIDSVISNTFDIEYEIILVDNASQDGSKEFFSTDSRIRYIYNDENLGFGKANNKGLGIAKGRNILFLNSDTILLNNAIKILSDYLDIKPNVGVCGGNLLSKDLTPNLSFMRYAPSIYSEINRFAKGLPDKVRFGKNIEYNHTGKPLKVFHITGADFMVRKSVLDEVGSFNPRFFMYFEETELCWRIHKAGYTVMSVPEASIVHLDGKSFKDNSNSNSSKRGIEYEKSKWIYFELTHSRFYIFIVKAVLEATILSRAIINLLKK